MGSPVDVVNMALDAIGTRSTISDLREASNEAAKARLHYPYALDQVLQSAHWNFARQQVALTLLKDATAVPAGTVPAPWRYEYAYPADCVQARYIMPFTSGAPASSVSSQPVYFLIANDQDAGGNDVKVILTNQPQATLVYTKRITNVDLYDATFTRAFSCFLGALLAIALTGDKTTAKIAFALADQTSREARSSNGNEGLTVIDSVPDWIRARGFQSDWAAPAGSIFWQSPQNLVLIT